MYISNLEICASHKKQQKSKFLHFVTSLSNFRYFSLNMYSQELTSNRKTVAFIKAFS